MKHKDEQAHVPCSYCGTLNYVHDAKRVDKEWQQGKSFTLYFCNDNCHSEFYLERLRGSGL